MPDDKHKLAAPFAREKITRRQGRNGRTVSYIEVTNVIDRSPCGASEEGPLCRSRSSSSVNVAVTITRTVAPTRDAAREPERIKALRGCLLPL